MYSPLAWVIIGGLLSSTLIARIVTPAIYKLIPPAVEVTAREPRRTRAGSRPREDGDPVPEDGAPLPRG
jgi:hypothetical protein